MAYCFKRRESVAKAIKRFGRERIEHALESLNDARRAEAIHCARKDIKKTRALLRLVRTGIPKKEFRRLTTALREAATHLAASRDAYIKTQTLRHLAEHFKGQLAPGALRPVRAKLRKTCDEEMKRFGKEKTANYVERTLRRAARILGRLKVRGKGWKALNPGVKATYRQGRQAYKTAETDSLPENFHAWRKRAKDLWYQVRLLHPTWPEQLDAMASELGALGDNLGDDHDLTVLRQDLEQWSPGDRHTREFETLHGLIEERQRELRAAALALGTRFYAEKPSMFCSRLAGYWQTWRREENSVAPSAAVTP